MDLYKILLGMSIAGITLSGVSLLDSALTQHLQNVAAMSCSVAVINYSRSYRDVAEKACLSKNLSAINEQMAPMKKIKSLLIASQTEQK